MLVQAKFLYQLVDKEIICLSSHKISSIKLGMLLLEEKYPDIEGSGTYGIDMTKQPLKVVEINYEDRILVRNTSLDPRQYIRAENIYNVYI